MGTARMLRLLLLPQGEEVEIRRLGTINLNRYRKARLQGLRGLQGLQGLLLLEKGCLQLAARAHLLELL